MLASSTPLVTDFDVRITAAREAVTTAQVDYDRNLPGAVTHHSTVPYAAYRAASQALSEAKADLRRLERQRAAQHLAEA